MSARRSGVVRRIARVVVPLATAIGMAAGGVMGSGCQTAPPAELPSPETGQFLTLDQQRVLSQEQVEAYCRMLDEYLTAMRSDTELAKGIDDSLAVVLDSLTNVQSEVNRESRLLERELREMKQARRAATTYVTQDGDTLMKLSGLFYGTAADWRKIYDANRDKIEDPGVELKAGITLTIP